MEEVKKEVKKAKPEQKKRTGNSVTGKPLDQIDTTPQLDSVTEEAGKAVVLTYGRMNPPTIGHEKLINKVKQHAKEHNADHLIVASHSQDAKKNPLTADQKLHHLHRAFPGTNIQVSNKEHPSFIHQLKKLSGKYDHVHLVVGSDRVPEFEKVANKYNGKEYHFKKIHVVSAGHRDPDAEGAEGMSASKMREHVKNNDYDSFKKGIPSKMSDSHSKRMFHDIRSGMGLHEEVEQINEEPTDPNYHAKVHQDLQWHASRNKGRHMGAANYNYLASLHNQSHIEKHYEKTVLPILKKHGYPAPPEGPGDSGNQKYHDAVRETIKKWKNERRVSDVNESTKVDEEVEQIDEKKALTVQQRQQRARQMRVQEPKLERKRELAKRKIASKEQLQRRAMGAAREIVKKRFSAKKGVRYQELTTSEKMAVDRAVETKTGLIKKIASRLMPKIRQAEFARFKSFTGGAAMKSMHSVPATIAASYEPSLIDQLFEQFLSKEQSRSLQTAITEADVPDQTNLDILLRIGLADIEQLQMFRKAMKNPEKSVKDPLLRGKLVAVLNKIMDIVTKDPSIFAKTRMKIQQKEQKALFKKSQITGLPLAVIEEVYTRGYEKPHSGMSPEQSGFARVNSFIAGGKAAQEDNDLLEREAIDRGEDAETKTGRKMAVGRLMGALNDREKHVITRIYTHGHTRASIGKDLNLSPQRIAGIEARALRSMKDHSRKAGIGAHQYNEETNENFMDGKGPGKPGDSARHGLKGKSATELRKIRSSDTASPRKKQLAHWALNMHHNEEAELEEKRGLWDNIHAKRKRIKAGSGERMRKPGSEGAPTKQNFRDASESIEEGYDVNSKHYKALTDLDLNTKNRDMTTQNDGYGPLNPNDEKGSKKFWEEKAKMWNTTAEAAREAHCGNCAAFNQAPAIMKKMAEGLGPAGEKIQELSNLGFCELFEFKCAGDRTCNKWLVNGPIKEETDLNENFNIQFASGVGVTLTAGDLGMKVKGGFELHPSVVQEQETVHDKCGTPECCGECGVEEEVRSADVEGVVVRTASGKTIIRKQKVNHKIIGTGNLTDGKPDDTV